METTYLVEIRLSQTKWRIRKITKEIARDSDIDNFLELHPHVTLFGPLFLNEGTSSQQMLDAIGSVAARYDPVPFLLDGWEKRDGMHGSVIAFPVQASEPLRQMTRDIARVLSPLTISQNAWDQDPEKKWFHVTITNRLDADRASAVFSRLTGDNSEARNRDELQITRPGLLQRFLAPAVPARSARPAPPVLLDETGIRITVMRDNSILAEYDLIEKRWIYGNHSHSSARWQKTLAHFRYHKGFEHRDPVNPRPDDIFLTADLHLGHANIIRYCSRPFLWSDVQEMDHVLIKNWNYSLAPKTRIYCLGDLRYGNDAAPAAQYRKRLRGDIVFIRGNHDEPDPGAVPSAEITCDGRSFLLIHDPADAPPLFDGWVIHGHHHNNDLRNYPFINLAGRRINVSVEVTGYIPVSLREILHKIHEREAAGNTSPVILRHLTGVS
jgi:calcineurin-like phosphoesterase family protein